MNRFLVGLGKFSEHDVDWPWCEACHSYHHPNNPTCKLAKPRQVSILCQYRIRGLHVHCRFFSGPVGGTRGNAGELIMRREEFTAYKTTLEEIGRGLIPNSAPAVFEFANVDPGATD